MSNRHTPIEPDGQNDRESYFGVDPDSKERLTEEMPDVPHGATRFEAPNGYGTADGPPYGQQFQERPILDGSTQSDRAEASVPNPYRGQADPARISRQPALNSTRSTRWLVSSCIAAVILTTVLLALAPWSPIWCAIGIIVVLAALIMMIVVRAMRMRQGVKLRAVAIFMTMLWLIPLAIVIGVLVSGALRDILPMAPAD